MGGKWDEAGQVLNAEAKALERGGATLLSPRHEYDAQLADKMMEGVSVPLVHIADATATAIRQKGLNSRSMATAFTMEQTFYTDRLVAKRT